MSAAGGKSGFPQPPSIGGGPAPAQPAQQPDIYARRGGLPNVDSDPFTEGYQPPGTTPVQQPQQTPSQPGGKGGFQGGPYVPRPDIGPGVGFGPGLPDPNAPNPLGPEGQQSVTPQPPVSIGMPGGKGGFAGPGSPGITQQQFQDFANQFFR